MIREELEITRRNITPAQFLAYVRSQIRKRGFESIKAEDIELDYWKAGNDLNFDIKGTDPARDACKHERSISKPYEMQTYILNWDGTVYNLICEFNFWDEKTGTGYFYFINTEKTPEDENTENTETEKENKKMKKNMIDLETLKQEIRQEIGADAAYLTGDYNGYNSTIEDAISERADSETSIYYSDIIKFISENVEAVNDAIQEFGWDGAGADLYKAGQLAEYLQIENSYREKADGIIKFAAVLDLIDAGKTEIAAETWEAIESELENVDISDRFDDITDIVKAAIEEADDEPEQEEAGTLDRIAAAMKAGFNEIADKAGQAAEQKPESVTA